jgi:hypothetical protein
MRRRLTWALELAACAAALAVAARVPASAQDGVLGTLEFRATVDEDGDGEYTPALCAVVVYALFEGTLPDSSVNASDLPAPITSASTGRTGLARIELPAGRYTLRRTCTHDEGIDGPGGFIFDRTAFNTPIVCCPAVKASPRQRVVYNEFGRPALVVQDVEIKPGEVTSASVAAAPNLPVSGREYWTIIAIVVAVTIVGLGLTAAWKFLPRYDPRSDPKNPKRFEPNGPERKPAGFDDVFGDFLKKR